MSISEFLTMYSSEIITLVIGAATAILTYIGTKIKASLEKSERSKTIEKIVSACVGIAERHEEKLSGQEKYEFAAAKASEWLATMGIDISEAELEMYIESACNTFKKTVKESK